MRALIVRLHTRGCAPCACGLHQLVFHQKSGGMYLLGQQAQGGAAEEKAVCAFFFQTVGNEENRHMLPGDGFEIREQFFGIRQSGKSRKTSVTLECLFRLGMRSLYGR